MADEDVAGTTVDPELPELTPIEHEKLAVLNTSRFLFVDVAAQRAKQLRRGALSRLDRLPGPRREQPHRLERVAMEEVHLGLVDYAVLGD